MMVIAKMDLNKNVSFLYKDRHELYSFATMPNVFFNTEEEAVNFIHYNYNFIKSSISDNDELIVLPHENKEVRVKFD